MSSGCATAWPGRSSGTPNSTSPAPTGMSMRPGSAIAAAVVADHDLAGHPVAGHDPLVRERQVDVVRRGRRRGTAGHDEQEHRDRAGDHPLHPAERDAEPSPTVAASATSTPAGRTVRALQSAAAAMAPRRTAAQTPSPTRRRRARARDRARAVVTACAVTLVRPPVPVAAEVRVRRDSVGLIRPRAGGRRDVEQHLADDGLLA